MGFLRTFFSKLSDNPLLGLLVLLPTMVALVVAGPVVACVSNILRPGESRWVARPRSSGRNENVFGGIVGLVAVAGTVAFVVEAFNEARSEVKAERARGRVGTGDGADK